MSYSDITVERREAALWIRLDRPDSLNSLTPRMVEEAGRALEAAEADAEVRCVVLTASGRAFCAGADLKEAQALAAGAAGAAATDRFVEAIDALARRIERAKRPVIAAVNGIALAGGMELVLACDLVVAAHSARLGDGHAKYGLLPGAGASARLPRKVGINRAKFLMFTSDLVSASELERWGLVNLVVPDVELDAAVEALAAKIAEKSPLGLSRMKQLLNDASEGSLEDALLAEQAMSSKHARSADRTEGLAAFAEKRAPRFTGR